MGIRLIYFHGNMSIYSGDLIVVRILFDYKYVKYLGLSFGFILVRRNNGTITSLFVCQLRKWFESSCEVSNHANEGVSVK